MKLTVKIKFAKEFAKTHSDFDEYVDSRFWYAADDTAATLDISNFSDKDLKEFHAFLLTKQEDPTINGALQKLSVYNKIRADVGNYMPGDLNGLASVLKEYIGKESSRKWLFKMSKDDNMRLPYLVTNIQYHPAKQKDSGYVEPARTVIDLQYMVMDEVKAASISFGSDDLKQKGSQKINRRNAPTILEERGYVAGMSELCEYYDNELGIFMKYRDQIGEQFISSGIGFIYDRYGRDKATSLNTDGTPHKLVVDEPTSRKFDDDAFASAKFWEKGESEATFRVPIHPYIRVFDLKTHSNYSTHTAQLSPYIYKPELIEKLILNDDVKELVTVLGNGTREQLGDIIAGKAEGIIVGCVGAPGLGKSLTAEIYAEFLKRPLYTVQCSQLGTDPDTLEKRLMEVLDRANRWGAILLLDEADVYIRARGNDLIQNAIVGVFLRVLEYYSGILFLTSNILNLDDAIESRFTAKIIYTNPTVDQLKLIWADQMENYGWDKKKYKKLIDTVANDYPNLTGRDVRTTLKLATLLARYRKETISYEILEHAGKFGKLSDHTPVSKEEAVS